MLKGTVRESAAEFFGTFILICFGCGVNAQVSLGSELAGAGKFGEWLSINFGWFLGVTLGIYACGGVSGAHLNPAVTLALAVHRGFPWSKVLPFSIAQTAGAFVGAALVFGVYFESFHKADPDRSEISTSGIFGTYPQEYVSTFPGAFLDQVVGTALLVALVFALGDRRNQAPDPKIAPLMVGLIVLGIGVSFGSNAGYAINPARDLGPRLFAFVAGWGDAVFRARDWYFWVPIVGPLVGAVVGGLVYDLFIQRHHPHESESQTASQGE